MILILGALFSSCSRHKTEDKNTTLETAPQTQPADMGISESSKESEVPSAKVEIYAVQITALNFLAGGFESCDVSNKIYFFLKSDQNVQTVICENSRVRVSAISQNGIIKFIATDISIERDLSPSSYSDSETLILGVDQGMMRFAAQNPYGFTYVMEKLKLIEMEMQEIAQKIQDSKK